jgi:hypothetical protein
MSKLRNLIEYYDIRRQVGHTTLMEVGALNFDRPAVLIVANHHHGRQILDKYRDVRPTNMAQMKLGELHIRTIGWLDKEYKAYNLPIIVDHFALSELYREHEAEWQTRLEAVASGETEESHIKESK